VNHLLVIWLRFQYELRLFPFWWYSKWEVPRLDSFTLLCDSDQVANCFSFFPSKIITEENHLLLYSIRFSDVLSHAVNSRSFFTAVKITEESPIEVYISCVTSIPVTNCLSFLSSEKITEQSQLDLFFFHVIFIIISTLFRGNELRK